MEKILTRYFWIFNLAALAAVAFFCASGVGSIAAASVSAMLPGSGEEQPAAAVVPRPRTSLRSFARPDGTPILQRNIFDSLVGPVLPGLDDVDTGTAIGDGEMPLIPCPPGQLKLLSTVASSTDAAWSFATIANGGAPDLYRVGSELDGRTVTAISWRYVLLRGTADECYLDLFGEEGALVRQPRPAGASDEASIASGIEVNGENERTVSRSIVDEALANPTKFARSVRVRPYMKDGETKGFRLRRIEKGSPLELLGAQRGDIIHSVNGVDLTSVDKALGAYQSLRTENKLTFSITRRGKPTDLVINIK